MLLSYALELFLKSGLVPLYHGCSQELFSRDLRRRYSHDLIKTARAIEYPFGVRERRILKFAQQCVLHYARYPLMVPDERRHIREWNAQTSALWDQDSYEEAVKLARGVRRYVSRLDRNESNPAHFTSYQIDDDGYFSFRVGGGLAPRITVKYSTMQKRAGKNNRRALRALVKRFEGIPIVSHYWDRAIFNVVKV